MKKIAPLIIAVILFVLTGFNYLSAQNTFPATGSVGIGTSSPNASSILEVKSTTKGMLVPRLTQAQRNAIAAPATGLLIYQTNTSPGFYYYNGSAWKAISVLDTNTANRALSNLTASTAINTNLVAGSNNLYSLGSTGKRWKNVNLYNLNFADNTVQTTAYIPYTAGTGINITGGVISNSKPDKTVSITGTKGTSVTGAYPSFTVSGNGLWNKNGNAGTTSSNFIGTTDSAALVFKVNNTPSGFIDYTIWNGTAFGYQTLQANTGAGNTAMGFRVLSANTTGYYNTALGSDALRNSTTGNTNTAVGTSALAENISGGSNTAIGFQALVDNTSGDGNVAIGGDVLYYNTTGAGNTAAGTSAIFSNSSGWDNSAFGTQAMYYNSAGSYNVGAGTFALYQTTASQYNTAIGYGAGDGPDNGYNNVFCGANTDANGVGYYNVIAIGQGTICTGPSQVTMGNSSTGTYRAYANWTNISDGRFKKNIKDNVPGLAFINKLQPVTYTLDATGLDNFLHWDDADYKNISEQSKYFMNKARSEKEQIVYTGFIAQDVEAAAKSLDYDFSGVDAAKNSKDVYGLRYAEFVVPLAKAVQELSKANDEKDARIDNLQKQVNELKAIIVSAKLTANDREDAATSSATLEQNIPNPFNHTTVINYTLPSAGSSAKIIIYDTNGKCLKKLTVTGSKGSVKVDAATLDSGAYNYALYMDGKLIAAKQMILNR